MESNGAGIKIQGGNHSGMKQLSAGTNIVNRPLNDKWEKK
jgi:hypothetical protein